jgi:thiol-disulfide isomerase/thioredoxin
MYMLSRLLWIILFFNQLTASAQQCTIRGEAKGYEGRKIAVVATEDELSGKRMVLAQADVSEQGVFQLQCNPGETRRIYLHLQRVEAPLYIEPGRAYDVIFPAVGKSDYKRFDNTEVNVDFVSLPADDINLHIRKFNMDYARFIDNHIYDFATDEYRGSDVYLKYLGEKKNSVDLYAQRVKMDTLERESEKNFQRLVNQFDDSVSIASNTGDSDFLLSYKRYSIAELYLLAGTKRSAFYEDYFMSITPPLNNPAFGSCFKLFSRNILVGQKAQVQSAILKAINVDRDLIRLCEAISADSNLLSDRLRKLAALYGLKEVYNNKSFDRASIDILLEKVNTNDVFVDSVARAMLFQLTKCRAGWQMQEALFTDESQERWSLNNSDGLPVYLLFFSTWSPSSLKEIQVMERWQEKFKGRVQFVGVCMDDDYRNYRKFLEDHLKLPMKLLYGNAEPFISEKFNLKSIPHQVMLDARQVVVADVCPAPSDPLFESFVNRIATTEVNKQGPKTWRDH